MSDLLTIASCLAATILSGRLCEVEYRQPSLKRTRGIASREGEKGVIHIRPNMGQEQTLKTLLHEIAHVKLHFDGLVRNDYHKKPPNSLNFHAPAAAIEAHERREKEAWELSSKWLNQAETYKGDNAVKLLKLAQKNR